jgi:hypothetical protein
MCLPTVPPTLETLKAVAEEKMQEYGMSREHPWASPEPRTAVEGVSFEDMYQLRMMVAHKEGRLNVDLEKAADVPADADGLRPIAQMPKGGFKGGFADLDYTDAFPSGNTTMSDHGKWMIDGQHLIFKDGESDEVMCSVWIGPETEFLYLFEKRIRDKHMRKFVFKPFGTYIEVHVEDALFQLVSDAKALGELSGRVTGSGRCRTFTRNPLPIQLSGQLAFVELADFHDGMTLWLRHLLEVVDSLAEQLDDRGKLLHVGEIQAELDELGVGYSKKDLKPALSQKLRAALIAKHGDAQASHADVETALGDKTLKATKLQQEHDRVRLLLGMVMFPAGSK